MSVLFVETVRLIEWIKRPGTVKDCSRIEQVLQLWLLIVLSSDVAGCKPNIW